MAINENKNPAISKRVNGLNKKKTMKSNQLSDGGQAQNAESSTVQPENASNSRNATKNITRMVIFHSLLNITGTVPFIIYATLNYGRFVTTTQQFIDFANVASIFLYLTPGLNIFIYYFFNKLYREVFQDYFKKIFFFIS
jgi:hypothetical protein